MADYTTVADVRLQSKLFTVGNIPDDNVNQFIDEANKKINADLGRTSDLSATEVSGSNAESCSLALVGLKCVGFDGTLYTNTSAQMADANMFSHRYDIEIATLQTLLGPAYKPTTGVVSSEDLR